MELKSCTSLQQNCGPTAGKSNQVNNLNENASMPQKSHPGGIIRDGNTLKRRTKFGTPGVHTTNDSLPLPLKYTEPEMAREQHDDGDMPENNEEADKKELNEQTDSSPSVGFLLLHRNYRYN